MYPQLPRQRLELELTVSSDHLLARDLAVAAGQLLLDLRAAGPSHGAPLTDADELRNAGDLRSHEFIIRELAALRPDDAVLSEEGLDDKSRMTAARVWIVDPLDGTREFGEPGRTDWAVHVALWERGELTAAAVALPALDRVLSTADPSATRPAAGDSSARLDHELYKTQAAQSQLGPRIVVSRSRPPAFVERLADALGAVLVPMGSAGAKAAAVICGEADAYVHSGGQYEWDSAAPVAVARAERLHASRIDGSSLAYNQVVPSLPDILICPQGAADGLLAAIAEVLPSRVAVDVARPARR